MTAEVRVCVDDAVGRRVITSGVHSIGASLIEGGLMQALTTEPGAE